MGAIFKWALIENVNNKIAIKQQSTFLMMWIHRKNLRISRSKTPSKMKNLKKKTRLGMKNAFNAELHTVVRQVMRAYVAFILWKLYVSNTFKEKKEKKWHCTKAISNTHILIYICCFCRCYIYFFFFFWIEWRPKRDKWNIPKIEFTAATGAMTITKSIDDHSQVLFSVKQWAFDCWFMIHHLGAATIVTDRRKQKIKKYVFFLVRSEVARIHSTRTEKQKQINSRKWCVFSLVFFLFFLILFRRKKFNINSIKKFAHFECGLTIICHLNVMPS